MVAIKKILVFSILILSLSCQKIYYFKNPEKIDLNFYTLPSPELSQSLFPIDSSALYLEVIEDNNDYLRKSNPSILKFHNDGFFEERSKKFYHNFEWRDKHSIYYGGKFVVYENNEIKIEAFYPSSESQTNRFVKETSSGTIKGDTIIINIFNSNVKYVKTTYDEVFY